MISIYIYGCSTCGVNGHKVRKVQAYGKAFDEPVTVFNTKYDSEALAKHVDYLKDNGLDLGTYPPIVVDYRVTELRKWTP